MESLLQATEGEGRSPRGFAALRFQPRPERRAVSWTGARRELRSREEGKNPGSGPVDAVWPFCLEALRIFFYRGNLLAFLGIS